jgi:hypothetical protein
MVQLLSWPAFLRDPSVAHESSVGQGRQEAFLTLAHIADPFRTAKIAFVPGAELEDFGSGLTPVAQGWFVVNVREAGGQ